MSLTTIIIGCILILLHSTSSDLIDKWAPATKYMLYTRKGSFELRDNNLNKLDTSKMTKFIIHGWGQKIKMHHYENLKDEYLKKYDYNIVLVDWSQMAGGDYIVVCRKLTTVGDRIGKVIATLHQKYKLPLENIHVIGHSLGGQLVGYVGRAVTSELGKKLKRITTLDASRPLFEMLALFKCISKNDAEFVDAIHTNAGGMGVKQPVGTVDFYPNGGTAYQPGCEDWYRNWWDVKGLYNSVRCSHQMSVMYFLDSMNEIQATLCPSWSQFTKGKCKNGKNIIMGEHYKPQKGIEGLAFLKHKSKRRPF